MMTYGRRSSDFLNDRLLAEDRSRRGNYENDWYQGIRFRPFAAKITP